MGLDRLAHRGLNPGPWNNRGLDCSRVSQGKPDVLQPMQEKPPGFAWTGLARVLRVRRVAPIAACLLGLAAAMPARAAAPHCPGPVVHFERLAEGLWLVPSAVGDASPANRGVVSNLLLARQGARWWLLGSGPSPAFGRSLDCQVRQRFGHAVTDVISPWARPELVLGQSGLPRARRWAHAVVAEAMREQCPACVERLHERLGEAATDLGEHPIAVPDRLLRGDSGRLGPFRWWLLPRTEGRWVTAWRHFGSPTWVAHGLLAAAVPGDGRDADLGLLESGLRRLQALAQADGSQARWVGEQGGAQPSDAPAMQARYWHDLAQAVGQAIDRADDETAPARPLRGWPPGLASHPWHALNWQRAWRQEEAKRFDVPAEPAGQAPRRD
jgi:hypothetical protein